MLTRTLESVTIQEDQGLLDLLIESNLASSKREGRTFIQSGAISLNNSKATDTEYIITKDDTMFNSYIILRRGKKKYAMILYK